MINRTTARLFALFLPFASINCAATPATGTEVPGTELRSGDTTPGLCSLERGKYCAPSTIGDVDAGTLPDSGWVCCAPAGTPCVAVSNYGECTMVGGWCFNYTPNTNDGTVTCHD